jgi:hypothetical protein
MGKGKDCGFFCLGVNNGKKLHDIDIIELHSRNKVAVALRLKKARPLA